MASKQGIRMLPASMAMEHLERTTGLNTRDRVLPNHIHPNILCGTLGQAGRKKQKELTTGQL